MQHSWPHGDGEEDRGRLHWHLGTKLAEDLKSVEQFM
ncbi:hypothetical protein J2X76_001427 [Neorhizobium sp. 2083]|nr:hypothetical protein [Neorhizobium sp. 2083]